MEAIRIIFAWGVYLIIKTIFCIYVVTLWCILAAISLFLLFLNFFGFFFGPVVGFIWLFIGSNLLGVFYEITSGLFEGLFIHTINTNQKINLFFTDTEEVPS
jgi:hypothetical protein